MNFSFSPEQAHLRNTMSQFLKRHRGLAHQGQRSAAAGSSLSLWKALAVEVGLQGATFSETLGGSGGSHIDSMIIMEEFGKSLVTEPYVSTIVVAGGLLKSATYAAADDLIKLIIAGDAIVAIAFSEKQSRYNLLNIETSALRNGSNWLLNGHKSLVLHGPQATHLIVAARTSGETCDSTGISLFVVDSNARGITRCDYPTVDGYFASEIYFKNVVLDDLALLGSEGKGGVLLERMLDDAIAATCAEACGVMKEMLDRTVDYTRNRKQFGQPLSSFQALQHRLVDMLIATEKAVSLTYMANIKLNDDKSRSKAASAAKVQIAKSCRFVAQNAVQLHGGMGVVNDLAIGKFFKRATILESAFGSLDYHLARYASIPSRTQ